MVLFALSEPPILYEKLGKAIIRAKIIFFRGHQELATGDDVIAGALYNIDTFLLSKLDKHYEYDPVNPKTSFFKRIIKEVTTTEGEKTTAWCYFANDNLQPDLNLS